MNPSRSGIPQHTPFAVGLLHCLLEGAAEVEARRTVEGPLGLILVQRRLIEEKTREAFKIWHFEWEIGESQRHAGEVWHSQQVKVGSHGMPHKSLRHVGSSNLNFQKKLKDIHANNNLDWRRVIGLSDTLLQQGFLLICCWESKISFDILLVCTALSAPSVIIPFASIVFPKSLKTLFF